MQKNHQPTSPRQTAWQEQLQRIFSQPWLELGIGILIVVSVALTMVELAVEETTQGSSSVLANLDQINRIITWIFVVELSCRWLAATNKRRFFREYWIDILAVLPLLRVFRIARAIRLLRLLRMLRLLGLFNRYISYFPYIVRRGAVEYVIVTGLIVLTILFGTGVIVAFEKRINPDIGGIGEAFWFSVYSLFSGEPIPGPPISLGGRIASVFIMFMSLTIFAMFTGTVSAFMVERLRTEGRVVEWDEFSDHVIVCGWNRRAEIIVREYQAAHKGEDIPIVVIAKLEEEPEFFNTDIDPYVRFLNDDFTKVSALEKAGIHRANTCIIMCDASQGRSEQDEDARTILAALTVEKLNPDVYTCAELNNREYGSHLEMGGVNDYVVTGEHSASLLAQAALNRGLMEVFTELLTHQRGNQFYRQRVGPDWAGRDFVDVFVEFKRMHNAILVAVHDAQDNFHVNPLHYTLQDEDHLILIAQEELNT